MTTKQVLGASLLTIPMGLVFWATVAQYGWLLAVIMFAATVALTAIIVVGAYLVTPK